MADKDFGVKRINLVGAAGTPTITSPTDLIINANKVAISTNATIGGSLGIGTTNPTSKLWVGGDGYFVGVITATKFSGQLDATSALAQSVGFATTATNLAGGAAGNIPYQSSPGITTFVSAGSNNQVLLYDLGNNKPYWGNVSGGSGAFSGITVRDEGTNVGTSGSITTLNFIGSNIVATATSGSSGIATITISDNLVGTSLSISGISTFNTVSISSGIISSTTGTAVTFIGNLSGTASYATTSGIATNIANGAAGNIPYQSSPGITTFVSAGSNNQVLLYDTGSNSPKWGSVSGASGAFSGITVRDEGTQVGTGSSIVTLNFIGSNIVATATTGANGIATITISDTLVGTSLSISGISTFGGSNGVVIKLDGSNGIITSANPGVSTITYYGDGSKLTGIATAASATNVALTTDTSSTTTNIVFSQTPNQNPTSSLKTNSGLIFNAATSSLGIGTTNPTSKLWVNGDGYFVGVVTANKFVGALDATFAQAQSVGFATTAINLANGAAGNIPYQSSTNTTAFISNPGVSGKVLLFNGSAPVWGDVSAATGSFGGISVQDEGTNVGTSGSITTLNFVGGNIRATATTGASGIATITISDNLVGTALSISGISTLGTVSISSGIISSTTGTAVTFIGNLTGTASYATTAGIATNLANGATGSLPYQSSPGITTFVSAGSNNQVLLYDANSNSPKWGSVSGANGAGINVKDEDSASISNIKTLNFRGDNIIAVSDTTSGISTITVASNLVGTALSISGISTVAGVQISSGIISSTTGTAVTFIGTFVGTASSAGFAYTAFTLNGVASKDLNVAYATTAGIATNATKLQTARTISLSNDLGGSATFDGSSDISISATIQPNSVALGSDTTGDYVQSISGTANQITVTNGTGEGSTPTVGFATDPTIPGTVTIGNNLYVNGNITVGGTTAFIAVNELKVKDKDIVLGLTTNSSNQDVSTDFTANHGGIAIASTEGSPLIDINGGAVIDNIPTTYKQIMWLKSGTWTGLGTDAWLFNYGVGIGSTQFPSGTRLAVGNVQFTQTDLAVVKNINATGVITATKFDGSVGLASTATNLAGGATGSLPYQSSSGITTFLSGTSANNKILLYDLNNNKPYWGDVSAASGAFSGITVRDEGTTVGTSGSITTLNFIGSNIVATATTGANGIATITISDTLVGTSLSISGISTFNSVRISSGIISSTTGTAVTFIGNLTGTASYATTSGIATNLANGATGSLPYQSSPGITTFLSASGSNNQVLLYDTNSNSPKWGSVSGANGAFGGISVQDEGTQVGTGSSIVTLNFVGSNIRATATTGASGIATITIADNLVGTSLSISGISTLGTVSISSGIISSTTGTAVTFIGNLTGTASYATTAGIATNIANGSTGNVHYQSAPNITAFVTNPGVSGKVLLFNGSVPVWGDVSAASGSFGGISVQDEGTQVGTGSSIVTLNFVGSNIKATATTGASGIATITISDNLVGTALSISGITTVGGVQISSGIITSTTGTAVTYYGDGSKLTGLIAGVSISTNTTNQAQYLTYVTGTGSTAGFGITTTGLVFNPSSGNLGIGTTNPQGSLQVGTAITMYGSTGIISATKYYGDGSQLTGTIPNSVTNIDVNQIYYPLLSPSISGTISSIGVSSSSIVFNPGPNYLGIGTTNPTTNLDVVGNIKVSGFSTFSGGLEVTDLLVLKPGQQSSNLFEILNDAQNVVVAVTTSGNLGIGSTNPTSKLWVNGDGYFTGVVTATKFYGTIDASYASAQNVGFATTSINVIGGIASVTSLTVSGNSIVSGFATFSSGLEVTDLLVLKPGQQGSNLFEILNDAQDVVVAVNTSGNLGIGTTTPSSKLWVNGNGYFTGVVTATKFFGTIDATSASTLNVAFASTAGIATYATKSGVSTDVIGGIASVSSLFVNGIGISTLGTVKISSGIVTATSGVVTYYGDGSKLSNIIASNSNANLADIVGTALSISGISTLGTVKISSGIITATSGVVTYYGDGSKLTGITATANVSISTNTANQSQYLTYVTGTGSTTGFGITTTGLVFNPSTGNLGIGSTVPTSKLTVQGNVLISGITTSGITRISSSTVSPNDTIPVATLEAVGSGSDYDIAIVPKGTGAIVARIPDGTSSGGNKRGTYAVDLQLSRNSATQVASGNYSFIGAGANNTVSGVYASILSGVSNTASGGASFIGGGTGNTSGGTKTFVGAGEGNNTGTSSFGAIVGGQSNAISNGAYSFIGGGSNNQAQTDYCVTVGGTNNITSGQYASILGGQFSIANKNYSSVIGGYGANTRNTNGAVAFAGANTTFGTGSGVALQQARFAILSKETTDATLSILTADGSASYTNNVLQVVTKSAYLVKGSVIAYSNASDLARAWEFTAAIKNTSGTPSLVGTPIINDIAYDSGASGWNLSITADSGTSSLKVEVTGQSSTTIRWVTKMDSTEVAFQ